MNEGTIFVAINNETAKLYSCNSSGRTVYWNSKEEAENYIQADGWATEFYTDDSNAHKLIHADEVRTISKYG